jgi:hypothetical protein
VISKSTSKSKLPISNFIIRAIADYHEEVEYFLSWKANIRHEQLNQISQPAVDWQVSKIDASQI